MSQKGITNIVSATPSIPTSFVTDAGTAVPVANTLNLLGGEGIDVSAVGNTITVSGELATAAANIALANLGICAFDSADFTVVNGFVSIAATFGGIQSIQPDVGAPVVPDGTGLVNIIGGNNLRTISGLNTLTIEPSESGYPTTPYVVGTADHAGYLTIQSACDAATADGGGIVVVQPGTYTEDLTLYDGVHIMGLNFADAGGGAIIVGVHTPPVTGGFVFRNVRLESATHIFSSAVAGTAHLVIADAYIAVTNGYTYNLPNWTGTLETFDVNDFGSTNDGFINNTGGSDIAIFAASVGAGVVNPMIISGTIFTDGAEFFAPVNFTGAAVLTLVRASFADTVTCSDTSSGSFTGCDFSTGANIALTTTSTNTISLLDVSIDSSAANVITGTGTVEFGSVTYLTNSSIAGTITKNFTTRLETGELKLNDTTVGALIANTGVVSAIAGVTGQLFVATTGADPAWATTSYGDFSFTNLTSAATPRTLSIVNVDVDAASTADLRLSTPPLGGDSMVSWEVQGTLFYSAGIDNSDSDKWKLTTSSDPSGGTAAITVDHTTAAVTFASAYEFPVTDGTAGYVLKTDGAGNLDWAEDTAGTAVTSVSTDAGNVTPSSGVLTLAGGTNINTSGAGSTATVNLDDTITLSTVNATTFDTNVAAAGVTLAGTTLSADGTDANIDLTITPKGTGSAVISKVDINGGTIDNSDVTVGAGKTLDVSAGNLTLADNQISGDKVEGGTINAITITTLTSTTANITTLDTNVAAAGTTLSGTTLSTDGTDANISLTLTAKGTGTVNPNALSVNSAYTFPTTDGDADQVMTTDGSGTVTWEDAGGGGISWLEATADVTPIAVNTGYITKHATPATKLVYTLPSTAAQGSIFEVLGYTSGGWKIAQQASQKIIYGNQSSTVGAAGYIESTLSTDSIKLVCVTADTEFMVIPSGDLTLA